jgi:predicted nuclease with RNAse H fold
VLSLGADLAAQPENTAACAVHWRPGLAEVREIVRNVDDSRLLELLGNSDKAGIDVPFGWPTDFVHAVAQHHQFLPWPANQTQTLRYRETDLFVAKECGRWPLSVSTDRIGVPAMRVAALMSRMNESVDRSGSGKLVEVYPAAALRRWGFESRGYKSTKGEAKRRALIETFLQRTENWLRLTSAQQQSCSGSDDSFDALICALVARASAIGQTEPVPKSIANRVRGEGWIALPFPNSLDKLADG